jgi:putative ABC transport system permease protein
MVGVGKGAEARLLERIRAMGTDMLIVSAAPPRQQAGRARQGDIIASLWPADVAALAEECAGVRRAAGAVERSMVARQEGNHVTTTVVGLSPPGLVIRNVALASGRLYDEDDERVRRRVAILGPVVARNLFGAGDPLGQTIRLGTVPFEVIGVTVARGADASGLDQDNLVFVPLETGMRRLLSVPHLRTIYLQASSSRRLLDLEDEVREILRRRRRVPEGGVEPFKIMNQATLLASERETAQAMTLLIGSVAVIALLVGGAGILAVMILAVRERTREIGLRRALGARRKDVLLQFLLEAGLLAAAGGVGGASIGVGGTALLAATGAWDLVLSWPAAVGALAASVGTGLAFGVYPAMRAARLTPVKALRAE